MRQRVLLFACTLINYCVLTACLSADEPAAKDASRVADVIGVPFTDDFQLDSRDHYKLTGKIQWSKGKVVLQKDATMHRGFEPVDSLQIEIDFASSESHSMFSDSEIRLWLDFKEYPDVFVSFWSGRGLLSVPRVLDIVQSTGHWSEATELTSMTNGISCSAKDFDGTWCIEVEHGVLKVTTAEGKTRGIYLGNPGIQVQGFAIAAKGKQCELDRWSIAERKTKSNSDEISAAMRKASAIYAALPAEDGSETFALAVEDARRRVSAIHKNTLGPDHPETNFSTYHYGLSLANQGDNDRASKAIQEALDSVQRQWGRDSSQYATVLDDLALAMCSWGQFEEADECYGDAKRIAVAIQKDAYIARELSPKTVLLVAKAHLQLGTQDFLSAEESLTEAFNRAQGEIGKANDEFAEILNLLGDVYTELGLYELAVEFKLESKAIYQAIHGRESLVYGISLRDLGFSYIWLDRYALAEPCLVRAGQVVEAAVGRENAEYTTCLNQLAFAYESVGDYVRALELATESVEISRTIFGRHNPNLAASLLSLGSVTGALKDHSAAVSVLTEARDIFSLSVGKTHPAYAGCLMNLGKASMEAGDHVSAKSYLEESLGIWKSLYGPANSNYHGCLHVLSQCNVSLGDFETAEEQINEVLFLTESWFGKSHSLFAKCVSDLAKLHMKKGDFAKAEPLFRQAIQITRKHLESTAVALSDQQQLGMNQSLRFYLDSYIDCLLKLDSPVDRGVGEILSWKGSVLSRQRTVRQIASQSSLGGVLKKLRSVTQQYSAMRRATPPKDGLEGWRKRVAELKASKEELESIVARGTAKISGVRELATLNDIQNSIPDGGVLIDFLVYTTDNAPRMVASIVRRSGQCKLVDLGEEPVLRSLVDQWLADYGMGKQAADAGMHLRHRVWEPILPSISKSDLILVSTDGPLGRIPLSALPGKAPGTYLIEDHHIVTIPVPQMLPELVAKPNVSRLPHELLLMGDVDYDHTELDANESKEKAKKKKRLRPWERIATNDDDRGGLAWKALSETANEVRSISQLYRELYDPNADAVIDLRKTAATESAFRRYAGKAMFIHLATHAYFSPPEVQSALSTRVITDQQSESESSAPLAARFVGNDPGQLSGLVFAGANVRQPFSDQDDGIMTADEIASLNMDGVRLAVLSACQTGLGEVAGGEGLLGIQRSFQVAGARSTIATLWNVNDASTRRLMQEFYRNYLEREKSLLDSMRDTQIWALNHPSEVPRAMNIPKRDVPKRLAPKYWAPFVLSGDWR